MNLRPNLTRAPAAVWPLHRTSWSAINIQSRILPRQENVVVDVTQWKRRVRRRRGLRPLEGIVPSGMGTMAKSD